MQFNVHEHRLTKLAARFNLMVTLVFGLLVSNVLMGGLAWYSAIHQRIEITPFSGSPRYSKSDTQVDSQYLALMSENFIYSRLNVTPETVESNHRRLLTFVDSSHYAAFNAQLEKEAKLIKLKKISSHFDITDIRMDSKTLRVVVTGILKRAVGFRDLKESRLNYTLQFRYHFGRLSVTQFTHTSEQNHE